jgi:hypothetical protein
MRRLERRLTASLEWLNTNIDCFSTELASDLGEPRIKALSELAIAYAWLDDCRRRASSLANSIPLQQSLELWRTFIIKECEAVAYGQSARRRPALAFCYLLPYLALRPSGYQSSYHEDTIRLWRRWGYPAVSETVPYRVLDRQYFLRKFGVLKREPGWRSLYDKTTLARTRCIAYLDRADAYSITHTLFYLTDFGNRPLLLPDSEQTRIKEIVEALLVHYWRTSYWDLVGELLINLKCLKLGMSICYTGASDAFQRVWLKDGSVPPHRIESEPDNVDPTNNGRGPDEDKGPDERSKIFRRYYHTTLVGALYCAVTLSLQHADGANAQETAAVRGDTRVSDSLVGRIRTASRRGRRWLGSVATPSRETVALQKLGILLCERISAGLAPPLADSTLEIKFPKPEKFVVLPRADLLRLAQIASVGERGAIRARNERAVWSKILGGLALSYAGSGDLSVVAALVRAGGCLRLDGPWLEEALVYLLDQQQPAGCFGLLAVGPSLTSTEDEMAEASLRLTVEVLWALAAARHALDGQPIRTQLAPTSPQPEPVSVVGVAA